MNEEIMMALRKEAKKAQKIGDIPVGCVIVCDGEIVAKGHNKKKKTANVMDHAEVVAIKKAAKRINDWRLEGCELYVTLEPCKMCREVIKQSRIKKVFYCVNSKFDHDDNRQIEYFTCENKNFNEEMLKMVQSFFKKMRKK